MTIFRGIIGIIIGTALAYVVGIMFDYFKIYKGEDYQRVFPFLTALGGGIASIVAILIRGAGGTARVMLERAQKVKAKDDAMGRLAESLSAKPPSKATASPGAASSAAPDALKVSESKDVPGMPTFEVPKSGSSSGSGSRPGGAG